MRSVFVNLSKILRFMLAFNCCYLLSEDTQEILEIHEDELITDKDGLFYKESDKKLKKECTDPGYGIKITKSTGKKEILDACHALFKREKPDQKYELSKQHHANYSVYFRMTHKNGIGNEDPSFVVYADNHYPSKSKRKVLLRYRREIFV